jgi:spermidine synthase
VRALFAATLFCSAALLFLVQPMAGKMVLPYLGGSPAVWNTCMVFFQAILLLGYLYAHRLTSLPGQRRQVIVHLGVLGLGGLALLAAVILTADHSAVPVLSSLAPTGDGLPVLNVLSLLAVAVGLPFFAVSTSAPLLQKWFAATGHPSAKDPYFLYAASNAGSLLFLLGYPLLVEPTFRVVEQTWLFAGGFALLVALVGLCGKAALSPLRPPPLMVEPTPVESATAPTARDKLRWLLLAFVPSSLMLGVTTHLTTDIAAIPLLWVLPLGLYLLTFIIAFSKGGDRLRGGLNTLAPIVILLLVFVLTSELPLGVGPLVGVHSLAYFVIALTLHTELSAARPHPAHLTTFYLWVSVGGVLGGAFNGLLAPLVFPLPFEYAAAVVMACGLLRRGDPAPVQASPGPGPDSLAMRRLLIDTAVPFGMVIVCMLLRVVMLMKFGGSEESEGKTAGQWVSEWLTRACQFSGLDWSVDGGTVGLLLTYGPPCLLAFVFADRPVRFALAALAILFVHSVIQLQNPASLVITRTYFGVLAVQQDSRRKVEGVEKEVMYRQLLHGTTLHGSQFLPDEELEAKYPGLSREPLMYYHRSGPVGDVFRQTLGAHADARVGVVGLGVGATAAYMGEGQSVTFFEIDPKVVELVDGPRHFTYLTDARRRGAMVHHVLGDARLTLAKHTGDKFHLLLVDAFSSDSIPLHLITVEAMRLYADRVTDDGLVGIHISNRFMDLAPVVAALAKECGLACRVRTDRCEDTNLKTLPDTPPGKTSSCWMVLARSEAAMEPFDRLTGGTGWWRVEVPDRLRAWTDDYADVLSVMKAAEVKWLRSRFGLPSYAK